MKTINCCVHGWFSRRKTSLNKKGRYPHFKPWSVITGKLHSWVQRSQSTFPFLFLLLWPRPLERGINEDSLRAKFPSCLTRGVWDSELWSRTIGSTATADFHSYSRALRHIFFPELHYKPLHLPGCYPRSLSISCSPFWLLPSMRQAWTQPNQHLMFLFYHYHHHHHHTFNWIITSEAHAQADAQQRSTQNHAEEIDLSGFFTLHRKLTSEKKTHLTLG